MRIALEPSALRQKSRSSTAPHSLANLGTRLSPSGWSASFLSSPDAASRSCTQNCSSFDLPSPPRALGTSSVSGTVFHTCFTRHAPDELIEWPQPASAPSSLQYMPSTSEKLT